MTTEGLQGSAREELFSCELSRAEIEALVSKSRPLSVVDSPTGGLSLLIYDAESEQYDIVLNFHRSLK